MSNIKGKPLTGMLAYIVAVRELRASTVHKKCLMQYYASNVNNEGTFFKSMLDICAETRLSEAFVRKTNQEWRTKNFLLWTEGKYGNANTYKLNLGSLQRAASGSKPEIDQNKEKKRQQVLSRVQRFREKQKAFRAFQDSVTNTQVKAPV